jgi:hypothetical protein
MLHDPLIYSDPHKFNPDRFINNAEAAGRVNNVAFGFGRRFASISPYLLSHDHVPTGLVLVSIWQSPRFLWPC